MTVFFSSIKTYPIAVVALLLTYLNPLPLAAQVTCIMGSYTGTASTFTVTGLGFQPDAVIIKGNAATDMYVKTSTMGATSSRAWQDNGSLVTNAITGFTASGFVVGTNAAVNTNGTTYYWVAFDASSSVKVGTYTGNGSDRNIALTGGGLAEFGIIIPASTDAGSVVCIDGTEYAYGYNSGSGNGNGNGSGGVSTSGMDVYSSGESSTSSVTYHYIAFLEVAGVSRGDSYTGNNANPRSLTGMGFNPEFALIYMEGASTAVMRTKSLSGDATSYFTPVSNASNLIEGFVTGGLQLGNGTEVNASSSTYYYFAMGGSSVINLPIELMHFNVQCSPDDKNVTVHWTTATESNNDFFTVEYSKNGIHFTPLCEVKGAGNSNRPIDYHITHENYEPGETGYYRLRQTDFDGKNKTFGIVASQCSQSVPGMTLTVIQNPLQNKALVYDLKLEENDMLHWEILSPAGQVIKQNHFYHRSGIGRYYEDLRELPPGVYWLRIGNKMQQQASKIVIPF